MLIITKQILIVICILFLMACSDKNDISHYTKGYSFEWATEQYRARERLSSIDEQFANANITNDLKNKLKFVGEASRMIQLKGDDNLFFEELERNINTKFTLKSEYFIKHQNLEEKVNTIKDTLLEKIKGIQNKEEIVPLLATYLFILNDPKSTLK